MKDTIVAISTPMGVGAISVVRLSGNKALEIVKKLTKHQDFKDRYATLCHVYDEKNEILDEVIVLFFANPRSYTCEDVCEIQCHGGVILAKEILRLCLFFGARLARSGEFTKRAFLNGRLDFSQAQAISQIISAQSLQASKMMSKQLKGSLNDFVEESREELLRALAFSEVMIDYSDEDIPEDTTQNLFQNLEKLEKKLGEILEFSKMRNKLLEGYTLSIIGKPNVGKSSLLNAILMQDRAIVSDFAGTTRDTIEETINLEGNLVKIIDTAGIRESEDRVESIGIQRSIEAMRQSDFILAVFDLSRALDEEDLQILEYLTTLSQEKFLLIIYNKSDLPRVLDIEIFQERLEGVKTLSMHTKDTQGVLQIKEILSQKMLENSKDGEILLCAEFQLQAIRDSITALQAAKSMLETLELELFSYHIKEVITFISQLTKPYDIDEMFDKMFGEFCLGK